MLERLAARPQLPAGAERIACTAPFDGTDLGSLPAASAADVSRAFERARAAQPAWAARPLAERIRVLRRFHALVGRHVDELLDLVQLETGKSRLSALEEALDVLRCTHHYAARARSYLRPRRRSGAMPVLTRAIERHVPKGVVGLITPWNYPLTLVATDAVPALVAGDAVVAKPDSKTPYTALRVAELLHTAGVPAPVFQVLPGRGAEVGPALVDGADFLMFTGSTATGRTVAARAAGRLIGCSAELGGKNPLLVLADADPERAAAGAVQACFANSGQLCVSIERIYAHAAIYDAFAAAFVRRVRAMRLAPGYGWEADMGSMIDERQVGVAEAHVRDAVARGARVLAGGRRRPELGPFFFEPTVLEGVTPSARVAATETFGPVVSLYRARDDADAIERANASNYGLNASVWGRTRHAEAVARRLAWGTVNVNEGYGAAWASYGAPMGGMRDSGLGRRHGAEGILKYTEPQTIATQRLLPIRPRPGQTNAAYAAFMRRAIGLLDRIG